MTECRIAEREITFRRFGDKRLYLALLGKYQDKTGSDHGNKPSRGKSGTDKNMSPSSLQDAVLSSSNTRRKRKSRK